MYAYSDPIDLHKFKNKCTFPVKFKSDKYIRNIIFLSVKIVPLIVLEVYSLSPFL